MNVTAIGDAFFVAFAEGILEEFLQLDVVDEEGDNNGLGLFVVGLEDDVALGRDEDLSSRLWNVLEVAWSVWENDGA